MSHFPVKVQEEERRAQGQTGERFLGKETFTLKPSHVRLDLQRPCKKPGMAACACSPRVTRRALEDPWSPQASQSS